MQKCKMLLPAALGAAAGTLLYLIAPGRSTEAQRAPFFGQNLAHRGLHDKDAGIPENSLAAFRAAAEAGYGVELDTRLTRDGFVVVSHDDCVKRMTGEDVSIENTDLAALRKLRLLGTEEGIPLFSEVLPVLVHAHVPVCVEVKPSPRRRELCEKVLEILDGFEGDFCVESFDPRIVRWWRINAPEMLRGQLTTEYADLDGNFFSRILVSRVLTNFLARPQFIAHGLAKKALNVRIAEALGAVKICWTSHGCENEAKNDVVIFEHYRPKRLFK